MPRKFQNWTSKELEYVITQYNNDVKIRDIAMALGKTLDSVKQRCVILMASGALTHPHGSGKVGKGIPEVFVPEQAEVYDKFLRISGDAISASDAHVPFHHKQLWEYILKVGAKFMKKGKRQLILNGDFLNLDSFSKWVTGFRGRENTMRELNVATKLLEQCLTVFDRIYWTQGNHENRLLVQLGGSVSATTFLKMVTTAKIEKRVIFSNYPYCILNNTWRITHPKNYGGSGGVVPTKLADKHGMSVVAGHNHLWGIQTSTDGKHLGIDQGMAADPMKLEYHQINDTTNRSWQVGFTLFLNNYAYPLSLKFTNWDFVLNRLRIK